MQRQPTLHKYPKEKSFVLKMPNNDVQEPPKPHLELGKTLKISRDHQNHTSNHEKLLNTSRNCYIRMVCTRSTGPCINIASQIFLYIEARSVLVGNDFPQDEGGE